MTTIGEHLPTGLADSGMDAESYDLVLKLMLDDARELGSRSTAKGKQREGTVSDTDLAFRLYAQELETAATQARDHRLSRSLQQAVQSDAGAITQLEREERMARHDRDVCIALSEGREPPPRPASPPGPGVYMADITTTKVAKGKGKGKDVTKTRLAVSFGSDTPKRPRPAGFDVSAADEADDDLIFMGKGKGKDVAKTSRLAVSFESDNRKRPRPADFDVSAADEADDDLIFMGKRLKQGESSSWAASRRPPQDKSQSEQRTCTSCMENVSVSRLIRAPCEHEYCYDCLGSLFQHAVRDESLFPPQCCRKTIPVDDHKEVLGNILVYRYQERAVEFSTQNRTYCHNAQCAAFIIPGCIEDDVGICIDCGALTCVHCKGASHAGDCPLDHDLQRVLQIARQEGWRRCYKCSAMVELNLGCYHMTCRCRAEFCYLCNTPWHGCNCPLWEERQLIDRAAAIDQRHNGHDEDPQQGERIDRIMDNLRDINDCGHFDWHRVKGRHQCETCGSVLPHYIYECDHCQVLACRPCRFNRV